MINAPSVYSNYISSYLDVDVSLDLDSNLIFIIGDSGSGKTFLWQVLNSDSALVNNVVAYNYTDKNRPIFDEIKSFKGKLIIIDNCDIILNSDLRKYIVFDTSNQYILVGRDVRDLFLTKKQFKKIKFSNSVLTLEDAF